MESAGRRRELSPAELAFVENEVAIAPGIGVDGKAVPRKKKRLSFAPLRWVVYSLAMLPLAVTVLFSVTLFRLESQIGGDSMRMLSQPDNELVTAASQMGFPWMKDLGMVYDSRAVIVGVLLTLTVLLLALVGAIEFLYQNHKRESKTAKVPVPEPQESTSEANPAEGTVVDHNGYSDDGYSGRTETTDGEKK